ncbi:type I-E CRISPR-associated protein Cas5/CasD [Aminipila butyrica]|uniref:Type I-E CRISPR-associated protein Cas5/CasD n=1 Tax=Aminipila butyrica TaxID=433296 RepID=A0A858BRZ9_9FIRM|nr:type I-E CRISPR-associated protein Cas5/CasD [Aminipila butyrica]QIB68683.1 type I-E CRISPR-associated protein Cas5/CasD [Aminipila butyrica]
MMKTIVLKFSGPLQSWGIGSHFETRDTARYPTKSAVMGLIGGALGYRRDETEKLQGLNELSFGVRIEQRGTLLKDFHIAKSANQSYVTNRYYLQDAVFLAMISHKDSSWLDTVAKALVHPVFPLYMGRRSVPVDGEFFQGMVENDLLSAIKTHHWQASEWYQKRLLQKNKLDRVMLDAYVDAYLLEDSSPSMFQRDRVESFDLTNRKHGFRPVKSLQVEIQIAEISKDTEHDAFQGIGGV